MDDGDIAQSTCEVIMRLADEGVPLRAIARATCTPAEFVRPILHDAVAAGRVIRYPVEDWPHKLSIEQRASFTPETEITSTQFKFALGKLFKMTPAHSNLMFVLTKREECTKETLHSALENSTSTIKIIDVLICHIRRKLLPFNIPVHIVRGIGYHLSREDRKKVIGMVREFYRPLDMSPTPTLLDATIAQQEGTLQ